VNPVKNNETQQRKGIQDRSMDRFEWKTYNETQQRKGNPRSFYGQIRMEDLDPLFMTNKNLGIRKTPQTVMEFPFDKSR
jgi:hypothetical protein